MRDDWDRRELGRLGAVTVILHDGRRIDLSGKSPAEAIDTLVAQGVTTREIKHTVIGVGRIPRRPRV